MRNEVLAEMMAKSLKKSIEITKDVPLEQFCRERLFVKTEEGEVAPFLLRPIQNEYLRRKKKAADANKPRKYLLLKYRRGGFTTLEQAESYRLCASKQRTACATLAHTKDSTLKISGITKLFRELDPKAPNKGDDKISLDFPETKAVFHLGTAGGKAFGRGDTLQRCHCSEVAWWCEGPNQFDDVNRLFAGITEATRFGEVVAESTPNGVEWFCATFRDAMAGLNDWTPIFFPWFADRTNVANPATYEEMEVLDTITDEENDLVKKHRLSVGQIAWRRQKILSLGKLFKQEYPEDPDTCFLTSGTPFFDLDVVLTWLDALEKTAVEPLKARGFWRESNIPGGKIVQAEPPEVGEEYVAGCDTSEGLPRSDPNGCAILRKRDCAQVAWVYGRFRPEVLAKHAFDLCHTYNEAFLGVERENHGHSVINTLQNTLGYTNMFFFRNEKNEPGPGRSGRCGWSTNVETRPIMLDDLELLVREMGMKIRQREFLVECTSFKLQPNGQYAADPGAHDDTISMWAIANQMRKFSRHRARVIILD